MRIKLFSIIVLLSCSCFGQGRLRIWSDARTTDTISADSYIVKKIKIVNTEMDTLRLKVTVNDSNFIPVYPQKLFPLQSAEIEIKIVSKKEYINITAKKKLKISSDGFPKDTSLAFYFYMKDLKKPKKIIPEKLVFNFLKLRLDSLATDHLHAVYPFKNISKDTLHVHVTCSFDWCGPYYRREILPGKTDSLVFDCRLYRNSANSFFSVTDEEEMDKYYACSISYTLKKNCLKKNSTNDFVVAEKESYAPVPQKIISKNDPYYAEELERQNRAIKKRILNGLKQQKMHDDSVYKELERKFKLQKENDKTFRPYMVVFESQQMNKRTGEFELDRKEFFLNVKMINKSFDTLAVLKYDTANVICSANLSKDTLLPGDTAVFYITGKPAITNFLRVHGFEHIVTNKGSLFFGYSAQPPVKDSLNGFEYAWNGSDFYTKIVYSKESKKYLSFQLSSLADSCYLPGGPATCEFDYKTYSENIKKHTSHTNWYKKQEKRKEIKTRDIRSGRFFRRHINLTVEKHFQNEREIKKVVTKRISKRKKKQRVITIVYENGKRTKKKSPWQPIRRRSPF